MKKLIVFCLSIMILLTVSSAICVCADAEPVFSASEVTGTVGEAVSVDVTVSKSKGISGLRIFIEYDSEKLKLTEIESADFAGMTHGPLKNNPIAITWIDTIHPENTNGGTVAKLHFEILDGSTSGKTPIKITYSENDVYNLKFENVKFSVKNGYVNISNPNAEQTSQVLSDADVSQSTAESVRDAADGSSDLPVLGAGESVGNPNDSNGDFTGSDAQIILDLDNGNGVKRVIVAVIVAAGAALAVAVAVLVVLNSKKPKK